MAYLNIHIWKCLKEELAWPIDERLQVISNKMSVISLKKLNNKAVLILKQYCMYCYVTLSNVF